MLQMKQENGGVLFFGEEMQMRLVPVTEEIWRCVYCPEEIREEASLLVEQKERAVPEFSVQEEEDGWRLSTGKVAVSVGRRDGRLCWKDAVTGRILLQEGKKEFAKTPVVKYTTGGEKPVIHRVKTVDGERNFVKNLREEVDHEAFRGRAFFEWKEGESIHGLGQAEEGIFDYRHHTQYLYQHNMRIPMPVFTSDEGYGMLFDCGCLMTFHEDENGGYLFFDTVTQLEYYFIAGANMDEIVGGIRELTGDAAMLPKWSFGYIQSKEQYYTAKELADVVRKYRELKVPLDGIVQDWNTWIPGNWGEKLLDKSRYGDLRERMDEIHGMGAHALVSVWPNMNAGGENHTEFLEAGHLLLDYATYNAFSEEAREMYWKQAEAELFSGGFDGWWCDSTEPFSGPDWGGEIKREPWERYALVGTEHKKYLEPEKANLFALEHAKGIFENQRKTTEEKRVINLTRSGYISGQKYGAMLWSGDTTASWKVMKGQLAEGLNMGLSGYPYWTLDIGGFFTVGKKWQNRGCSCSNDPTPKWFWQGRYDEGVKDKGFCELYTRWLQMGTFLPMFRSHGTDTPREIWNFGEKGGMFYDAIEKFIKLRYQLMPYVYSLAGGVRLQRGTMLRSLLFDFPADDVAKKMSTEFMFGKNLLICPVLKPMYYEAESLPLEEEKIWECYLPAGCEWVDFWDGKRYTGGQTVTVEAPMDRMPIFVRAGSILPMQEGLQYADQVVEEPLELHITTGADGCFTLYEDAGDGYGYEQGEYATVELGWEDSRRVLTLGERKGEFPGMAKEKAIRVFVDGVACTEVKYCGKETTLPL